MHLRKNKKVSKPNKQLRLQQLRDSVDSLTDRLEEKIDSGIKETVVYLNAFGFRTTQSCEDHLDGGELGPWVQIDSKYPYTIDWWQDKHLRE